MTDLSDRERDILRLMSAGLSNQEIADRLILALSTIKWYNTRIFRKLGVENRFGAIRKFHIDNLPATTTPFIGRLDEKNALVNLLKQPDNRVVTVLGPGGMGKTRLALAAAEAVRSEFPNGVYFIPTDTIQTPTELAQAIATAIDYRLSDSAGIHEQLLRHLRRRELLLVFDSFELAMDCVPFMVDLLRAGKRIKMLVTSRHRLNLHAETVYSLTGMQVPQTADYKAAAQCDAVRLFINTARRVKPDWRHTPENNSFVAEICRLTDGLPLGIVLAASWLDVTDAKRICEEIQKSIDFLARKFVDIPERQRSIRAVFDSSWKHLSKDEQRTFIKLLVFQGGFSLAAAEAVTEEKLTTLQSLVSKALVQPIDDSHFRIHNLLRQYGKTHVPDLNNLDQVIAAHARYFTQRIRSALDNFQNGDHKSALDMIQLDYDDITHAWTWAIQHRDYTLLVDLIEGLYVFNFTRLLTHKLFRYGLVNLGPDHDLAYAHLIARCWDFIDNPQGELERALPILREHGDLRPVTACLQALAWLSYDIDQNIPAAIAYHQENLSIFRSLDDRVGQFNVLCNLGLCAARNGDLAAAHDYYQQGAELEQDHTVEHTFWLALTAELAMLNGDFFTACNIYRQALQQIRHLNVLWGVLYITGCLGLVKLLQGKLMRARKLAAGAVLDDGRRHDQLPALVLQGMIANFDGDYQQAWELCNVTGVKGNIYGFAAKFLGHIGQAIAACGLNDPHTALEIIHSAWNTLDYSPALRVLCLPVIAWLHADCDDYQTAVELLSLATHHPLAIPDWLDNWTLFTDLRVDLETKMTAATFQIALEHGRSMTLDEVVLP